MRATPWVRDVSRDAIRHFAWGIGDDNPLWIDPEYAAQSRWLGIVAPPCFLYAMDETTVAPEHDELKRRYVSARWIWFDVLPVARAVHPHAYLVHESSSETGVLTQRGRVEYDDAQGVLLAQVEVSTNRLPAEGMAPPDSEPAYDRQELQGTEEAVLGETRRGGETRYWEDTQTGETLGLLLKGPVSIMDVVAWCAATQGIPEPGSDFSDGGLESEGVTGPQQVAWACQLVTDWMGDDGFLHRLDLELERTPGLGSTTAWTGAVSRCWQQSGSCFVELELAATDRRGQRISHGRAQVVLESRELGPVKLPLARVPSISEELGE